jgi:hypothetical protein
MEIKELEEECTNKTQKIFLVKHGKLTLKDLLPMFISTYLPSANLLRLAKTTSRKISFCLVASCKYVDLYLKRTWNTGQEVSVVGALKMQLQI